VPPQWFYERADVNGRAGSGAPRYAFFTLFFRRREIKYSVFRKRRLWCRCSARDRERFAWLRAPRRSNLFHRHDPGLAHELKRRALHVHRGHPAGTPKCSRSAYVRPRLDGGARWNPAPVRPPAAPDDLMGPGPGVLTGTFTDLTFPRAFPLRAKTRETVARIDAMRERNRAVLPRLVECIPRVVDESHRKRRSRRLPHTACIWRTSAVVRPLRTARSALRVP